MDQWVEFPTEFTDHWLRNTRQNVWFRCTETRLNRTFDRGSRRFGFWWLPYSFCSIALCGSRFDIAIEIIYKKTEIFYSKFFNRALFFGIDYFHNGVGSIKKLCLQSRRWLMVQIFWFLLKSYRDRRNSFTLENYFIGHGIETFWQIRPEKNCVFLPKLRCRVEIRNLFQYFGCIIL